MWVLSLRVPLEVVPLVIFADLNYKKGVKTRKYKKILLLHKYKIYTVMRSVKNYFEGFLSLSFAASQDNPSWTPSPENSNYRVCISIPKSRDGRDRS